MSSAPRRLLGALAFAVASFVFASCCLCSPTTDEQTTPLVTGPLRVGSGTAGGVIVDDYLKGATPDEAAEALRWCGAVPGCLAIWRAGVGTTIVLQPGIPDPSMDVGEPDPNTD